MNPIKRLFAAGISVCGGGLVYYFVQNGNSEKFQVKASGAGQCRLWDSNWDKREPKNIVPPLKGKEDETRYKKDVESVTPIATRTIYLVRHGQYNTTGKTDEERSLTKLGQRQAEATGKRLKEFGIDYTHLTVSTMTRAVQTSCLIKKEAFPVNTVATFDPMLSEGSPIEPEPPTEWNPPVRYFQGHARIEAAFRKYIHRAEPEQSKDSFEIIVCHANVIRYFLCRALQFPPEAWLRFNLYHASISELTIFTDGRVSLRSVGEYGHLAPDMLSFF